MTRMYTSQAFARWVVMNGKALIDHYYGKDFDLETGVFHESEVPIIPIEPMIPQDRVLLYWINNTLMFIKTLARLFDLRLTQELIAGIDETIYIGNGDDDPDGVDEF